MYTYPLLSFVTYNGNSNNGRDSITSKYVTDTAKTIASFQINKFGFWTATDTNPEDQSMIENTFLTYFGENNQNGSNGDSPPSASHNGEQGTVSILSSNSR